MTKEALSPVPPEKTDSTNPDWIPISPDEVIAGQLSSKFPSKIDEIFLRAAQEGKLFRLSPEATAEMDERFRKEHEEFEREMNRRAQIPVEPVYFPWHPMPLRPGDHGEDD